MCTRLLGNDSWFLPFNKGYDDGAGNPPNPGGIKTDNLWREILTPQGLTDILENMWAKVIPLVQGWNSITLIKSFEPRRSSLSPATAA
jgi:hypothetical protein